MSDSSVSEAISRYEAERSEIKQKTEEFEKSILMLTNKCKRDSAAIIDRATQLLTKLHSVTKTVLGQYSSFYGDIEFDDDLSSAAKLKFIKSTTDTSITFFAEETWSYGGFAEGYITIPKSYLEADLDDVSWFHNLCKEEMNRKKAEEIQKKIEQIEKLTAEVDDLEKQFKESLV